MKQQIPLADETGRLHDRLLADAGAARTVLATLPEWTNKKPDWRREVRPTMTIDGKVNSGPVTFRGIRVEAVESDLGYTNLTWLLPNMVARRPEGEVRFAMRSHTETQDFHFDFHSTIDPHAIKPALETEKQKKGILS